MATITRSASLKLDRQAQIPQAARCENCHFWDPDAEQKRPAALGKCRRFPPNPVNGHWSSTMHYDWCGEWRKKT